MISNICYAVVFLIESLISFYYFDFKFKRRISKKFIPISILLSGLVLIIKNNKTKLANIPDFMLELSKFR